MASSIASTWQRYNGAVRRNRCQWRPHENATPQINYEDYANKLINFHQDLTKSRSLLAKEARNLYKQRKINDTWVYDGKILIKDKNGLVKMINNMAELDTFK